MMFQLFNGDCLDVMATLPDKSVDCFVCDLPYGCLTSACGWDTPIDLNRLWTQIKRLARNDHVPVLMFCTTKFGFDLHASNPSWFRYDLVWDKMRGVSFLSANKMPMRSHEMVYVFSKKGAAYKRVDEDAPGKGQQKEGVVQVTPRSDNLFGNGLVRSNGAAKDKACVKSVIPIQKVGTFKQGHPTEKPVELYRWLLERYCPAGGVVLDPTFGSCNSGRAAKELGLKYVGVEMDAGFFKKAHDALVPAAAGDDGVIVHVG